MSPITSSHERQQRANDAAAKLLASWQRGEHIGEADIISAHPDLLPELEIEIQNARLLRMAAEAARKAGDPPHSPPVRLLSDDELDAPIELGSNPIDLTPSSESQVRPRIPGYVLLEQIDAGGQAVVYRAVQESTGRIVAVKVLGEGSLHDSRHRARFEREAEILASLRHPHIVNIIDRGRMPDGNFYFLMEYVDGPELDDWWNNRVSRDTAGTRTLLEQFVKICGAVEEAHRRGIVHRDLKPSNIRIDARGEPRVLDFGLARSAWSSKAWPLAIAAARAVTASGQLLGSVPWFSPEQAGGNCDAIDERSDVYAIGVMLYQALTDQFPYATDGPLYKVLDNVANAHVVAPSRRFNSRRFGKAGVLDAVVLTALAKKREQRYPSAGELGQDLQRVVEAKPIHATVAPRRMRKLAVAAVVALPLTVAAATWHFTRPPSPPTVFELPSITNSLGMRFVRIPAGRFLMGSPVTEKGRSREELQRWTEVGDFYLGTLEVTQQQYQQVMGSLPAEQRSPRPELPVHRVNFRDAAEFCRRISISEGRTYRLPREAEWEYACRAGSKTPFFCGKLPDLAGWYADNSGARLHAGGEKWANPWGLFDVHGNVREWCDERSNPSASPALDTGAALFHVMRGGSFQSADVMCRSAAREPGDLERRLDDVGFRIVLDDATSSLPEK